MLLSQYKYKKFVVDLLWLPYALVKDVCVQALPLTCLHLWRASLYTPELGGIGRATSKIVRI
jgi:hypothetical protein